PRQPLCSYTTLFRSYSADANHAVNIGLLDAMFEEARLSDDELTLIRSVAAAERRAIEQGDGRSPKLKCCGGLFWKRGRSERVARDRKSTRLNSSHVK